MNKYCKEFLESVAQYRDYWLGLDEETVKKSCEFTGDSPEEYRMNGLIFSIMVLIDGDSSVNDFKHYEIKYGVTSLNKGVYLHENIHKFLKGDDEK